MERKVSMILLNSIENDIRVKKECHFLVECGYEVEVICWKRESDISDSYYLTKGIKVVNIGIFSKYGSGKKQIFKLLDFFFRTKKYLKNRKTDILHIHDIEAALFLCFYKPNKVIVDLHEMLEKERTGKIINRILMYFYKIILKKVDGVILVSNYQLKKYKKFLPRNILFLYNYPSKYIFSQINKIRKSKYFQININYTGSVRNVYYLKNLITASKNLLRTKVFINGTGTDLNNLMDYCVQIDNKNVKFTGKFIAKDIENLYKNMDLTYSVLSENIENARISFPTKAYESLMLGIPLIVNKKTIIAEYIEKNKIGFCIEPNLESLKELLEDLEKNPAKIQCCKLRIQELIANKEINFCWEDQIKNFEKFYSTIYRKGI
ncbi:hypothetical protein IX293_001727 [Fusobacterium necrophorum]|nr:glycosyltransferase [Fusobacterium necrophorum]MBR8823457.1 hypothetical protein [Fusobacterium necrophorum]